jgi:UDP-N-acetylglucosamine--N-acetylmuramyl-(pentapeptide) pyrophosphoryl-undecaprenol N-acetylglucosamine transferase
VPFDKAGIHFRNPMVVGNPIRKIIREAAPATHTKVPKKTVITIIGGSQGAHIINRIFADILPDLSKLDVEVIHQSGISDKPWLQKEYARHPNLEGKVFEFIDDMVGLYQKSHLVISRAGSTINEIIAMGKASILIPIAVSSGDHQKENAMVMADAHASIMIEEKDLSPQKLLETITRLITNPNRLIEMGTKARALYNGDSANKIVKGIQSHFKNL